MASLWCPCYCYISPCLNKKGGFHLPLNTATTIITNTTAKQSLLRLQNDDQKKEPSVCVQEVKGDGHGHATLTRRRQIMLQPPLIAFSFTQFIMSNALAENDVPQDFRAYTDDVNMFKIFIPQDWQVGAGEPNGFKSITAFYPEEAANSNGFYYIEYTLQNPGESRKHLFSAIGMASNGWYNRLYTVTGQFVEEEAEKYGSRIEKAVSSFRFV